MKIALVGTEGTGKTTLAKAVSEKYNIPYVDECARIISKETGIKVREDNSDKLYEFQIKCLEMKLKEESKYDEFIADRSTIDNLVYYLRWVANDKDSELNEKYCRKCIQNIRTYDKIVLMEPKYLSLVKDEIRTGNIWYRESIHFMLIGVLEEYVEDYIRMPFVYLEDRVNYIGYLFDKEKKTW